MADRPDPYVRKDPGDIIRSGDWNELQVKAKEEIRSHRHTGGDDGLLIPRTGIEEKAIGGSHIDPAADVTVKTLTTSGNLTVKGDLSINGKAILGDIADLLATVKGLQNDKLNRAGDTITGTLNIQKDLLVSGGTDVRGPLKVAGEFIRKVTMATGLGPGDGTNDGQIVTRILTFIKYHADTAIRILYCDNLRVLHQQNMALDAAARWEIRVDGQSVPGGAIIQDKYISSGNYHAPATILGYAVGISAGTHTIGVWVGPLPGRPVADAHTGWDNSRWTLEAQEVWL